MLNERVAHLGDFARTEVLATVVVDGHSLPIHGITMGSTAPLAPTLMLVGGVHGLERIGTGVVLAYLQTLAELLPWDGVVAGVLGHVRLAFVPLLNPGGMYLGRRANPRGVDLMRNAPVSTMTRATYLLGGQRISPRLPWFMGEPDRMEVESAALIDFVTRHVLPSRFAVAVDCHSGFGLVDRLWFPFARSRAPMPHLPEMHTLKRLLDRTYPNHIYRIEPQAKSYTIAGDLWDHLYDASNERWPSHLFLPLTLEMGSWRWVRKNPRQALSPLGGFNPLVPHRHRRVLRRHLTLFDFLLRVVAKGPELLHDHGTSREAAAKAAFHHWYD